MQEETKKRARGVRMAQGSQDEADAATAAGSGSQEERKEQSPHHQESVCVIDLDDDL